jgi:hypothetical protein
LHLLCELEPMKTATSLCLVSQTMKSRQISIFLVIERKTENKEYSSKGLVLDFISKYK